MRSRAQFCSRLITGIAHSNPTKGMEVHLLCCLCVLWKYRSLRRAGHSFRGVVPDMCDCIIVCDLET